MKKISCFFIIPLLSIYAANAQYADTISSIPQKATTRFTITLPVMLIAAGIGINGNREEGLKKEIAEERQELFPNFKTRIDNYLQFSPIAIAYGLDAMGYAAKTDRRNRTAILLKGEVFMTGVVYGLKKLTHQLRPDNSDHFSFPSGHTAQAFAAATFLSEEYKHRFTWMPYVAYGLAGSVGLLRMANNKHYISDVLAGAGFGILSMKASYATHKYKWNRKRAIPIAIL